MILFRADGNKKIGSGHLMRCLSIADAMQEIGIKSIFVTADDSMSELLKNRGYENIILHTDYYDMDGELSLFMALKEFGESDGIVVDSYYVTDQYLKTLTDKKKTVYIDDLQIFRPVGAIVNYNIYAEAKEYRGGSKPNDIRLVLGPSFAPLRQMFQNVTPIEIEESVKNILFLAGGSDPEHTALKFVKELQKRPDSFCYTIVIGALCEDYDAIKEIADKSNNRIAVLKNVQNMNEIMMSSDIAISAAGSTLYELCACGIPTINYIIADNQILAAKSFEKSGAMIYGGDLREDFDAYCRLISLLVSLAEDTSLRRSLSETARSFVDGKGAIRLAKELEGIIY